MPWADLPPSVQARITRLRTGLVGLSQAYAGEIESTAKREAPWTDRTANARNRMNARAAVLDPDPDNYSVGIIASHGVEYGIWLEVRRRNIRQIERDGVTGPWTMALRPVVNRYRPRFLQAARQLAERTLGGGGGGAIA